VHFTAPAPPIAAPLAPVHRIAPLPATLNAQGEDRFGRAHNQATRILPANERLDFRWNENEYEVSAGGDGLLEADPGAFLLPYWMARFHGIIAAATGSGGGGGGGGGGGDGGGGGGGGTEEI
jgi:hypothetical protein